MVPTVSMSGSGLTFSKLVQGYWRLAAWQMTPQERLTFIKQHLELGISTVDHANIYGPPSCEALFGEALKLQPSLADEMQIISKCSIVVGDESRVWHYDATQEMLTQSVDNSLARLGVDHLDVLLIHRPDYLMNADEVADSFAQLQRSGKVKHFGVSNFTAAQFDLLQSRWSQPLITNQIELNPVNLAMLESGVLEAMQQHRVIPMAWSCLGGGKIFNESTERFVRLRACLAGVMEEVGAESIDQVIYAWVMKLPANPVLILGSGNSARTQTAVESLAITLTHEQWYRIWEVSNGHRVA